MLAGLLKPDKGSVSVNNQEWFNANKKINLSPQVRNVGFVFQEYALFPNMSVQENLEYALDSKGNTSIINELIELVELGNLRNSKPETLSGGQKQRVALARALVRKPTILMLDEPLSALDQTMRSKLQDYILKIHAEYNLTTLLVSHEINEICKMSDQVLVLEEGQIKQQGTPFSLFGNKLDNGKLQLTGEIIDIKQVDLSTHFSILIGSNLLHIELGMEQAATYKIGDKILISSDSFTPKIQKIE
jgi:molybdate transport system ATP-binding protein